MPGQGLEGYHRRRKPPHASPSQGRRTETWKAAGTLRGESGTIHLKNSQGGQPQVHPPPSILSPHARKTPFPLYPGGSLGVALAKERWVEKLSGTERSDTKLPRSIVPSFPTAPSRAHLEDRTRQEQPGMSPLGSLETTFTAFCHREFRGGFCRAFRSDTEIGIRSGFLPSPKPKPSECGIGLAAERQAGRAQRKGWMAGELHLCEHKTR